MRNRLVTMLPCLIRIERRLPQIERSFVNECDSFTSVEHRRKLVTEFDALSQPVVMSCQTRLLDGLNCLVLDFKSLECSFQSRFRHIETKLLLNYCTSLRYGKESVVI